MDGFFRKLGSERRPGLRIIKTGIAATLCVAVCSLLKLDEPFLAVIAAVLSMGRSIDFSVRSGKNKMIGVLIGTAIGFGCASISPANAGLCGLGVILSLYLCQVLRLEGAGSLTCFAFAAVLFGSAQQQPALYAVVSAENALIGIAASIAVNLFIFPPNYAAEVRRIYALLREMTDVAIGDAAAMRQADTEELQALIGQLSGDVRLYVSETKLMRGDDDEVFGISCRVSAYRMILEELNALNSLELWTKAAVPGDLRCVYDYHIGRLRKLRGHVEEAQGGGAKKKRRRWRVAKRREKK